MVKPSRYMCELETAVLTRYGWVCLVVSCCFLLELLQVETVLLGELKSFPVLLVVGRRGAKGIRVENNEALIKNLEMIWVGDKLMIPMFCVF